MPSGLFAENLYYYFYNPLFLFCLSEYPVKELFSKNTKNIVADQLRVGNSANLVTD